MNQLATKLAPITAVIDAARALRDRMRGALEFDHPLRELVALDTALEAAGHPRERLTREQRMWVIPESLHEGSPVDRMTAKDRVARIIAAAQLLRHDLIVMTSDNAPICTRIEELVANAVADSRPRVTL